MNSHWDLWVQRAVSTGSVVCTLTLMFGVGARWVSSLNDIDEQFRAQCVHDGGQVDIAIGERADSTGGLFCDFPDRIVR